jgi:hypothetical protein
LGKCKPQIERRTASAKHPPPFAIAERVQLATFSTDVDAGITMGTVKDPPPPVMAGTPKNNAARKARRQTQLLVVIVVSTR